MSENTYMTFDDIYTLFMNSNNVDEYQLPQTPEGMYALLEEGIARYLTFYDDAREVSLDRETELLSAELTRTDAMLIVEYMKLHIYEKIKDEFYSTYDVLMNDIGIRNFKSQADAKMNQITQQEDRIRRLLLKVNENFDI